MKEMWLVAKHEYLTNLRRPAFLFASFGAPLLTIVVMIIVFAVLDNTMQDSTSVGTVGYVDLADVISDDAAPENFARYDSEDSARAALDSGDLGAYFVVSEDYLPTGNVRLYGRSVVPEAVSDAIDDFLLASLAQQVNSESLFGRIQEPVSLTIRVQDTGRTLGEDSIVGMFIVPIIFTVVFMLASTTTSGYLMAGVVEEKANRVMEILITSITPLQLLVGKILGLGALGLTQLVIWLVAGGALLSAGQGVAFLSGVTLSPELIIISLIYFIIDYFLFAGIMAGIGATVGSEQESRQYAGALSIISIVPFFFFVQLLTEPDHPAIKILTLFPFTAPLTVILRMSLGGVPTAELVASIAIMLITTIVVVWVMARVFRWSLLLYGKRPTPRQLWHVIRGSAPTKIGTVATTGEQTA